MLVNKLYEICFLVMTILNEAYGRCPEQPRGRLEERKGTCFEFIWEGVYQRDAAKMCQLYGGHLVHVMDSETQSWLEEILMEELTKGPESMEGYWLGLRKIDSEGWRWEYNHSNISPAEPVPYTYWDYNEPDKTVNRECAYLSKETKFRWRATVCDWYPHTNKVVCEYDAPESQYGLFASKESMIAFFVALVVLVIIIATAVWLFYCYKKRSALRRQLGSRESPLKEINTDSSSDIQESSPPHYGEVDEEVNFNYNIAVSSNYKDREKDLSLSDSQLTSSQLTSNMHNRHTYKRSYSEPVASQQCASKVPSAPALQEHANEDEEDFIVDIDQNLLQKQTSVMSNDLSH